LRGSVALPVGDVDADLLHQPHRQRPPALQKHVLEQANDELRKAFGRD